MSSGIISTLINAKNVENDNFDCIVHRIVSDSDYIKSGQEHKLYCKGVLECYMRDWLILSYAAVRWPILRAPLLDRLPAHTTVEAFEAYQ